MAPIHIPRPSFKDQATPDADVVMTDAPSTTDQPPLLLGQPDSSRSASDTSVMAPDSVLNPPSPATDGPAPGSSNNNGGVYVPPNLAPGSYVPLSLRPGFSSTSTDAAGQLPIRPEWAGPWPVPAADLPFFQNLAPAPANGQASPPKHSQARSQARSKRHALSDRTGAGVKKAAPKPKEKTISQKVVDAVAEAAKVEAAQEVKVDNPFRFLDLPGEIRNLIYKACTSQRQALLVHRPRMASFRIRTRMDRQRALESDVKDKQISAELEESRHRGTKPKAAADGKTIARETNRPFYGLTQVCSQIRREFRPIYLHKQEVGMDITQICDYLSTFYFDAPAKFMALGPDGQRGEDMPFNGNLTIAVGDKPMTVEKAAEGVEVIPLLDIWANSQKIEAGFGRYLKKNYQPQTDGEAKDLYRLFGRRVLPNRACSAMNHPWRNILRNRELASITIHRKPAETMVQVRDLPLGRFRTRVLATRPVPATVMYSVPYIHVLFRAECAEDWMDKEDAAIPEGWLLARGLGGMEYFQVKVGVAPAGVDHRVYI